MVLVIEMVVAQGAKQNYILGQVSQLFQTLHFGVNHFEPLLHDSPHKFCLQLAMSLQLSKRGLCPVCSCGPPGVTCSGGNACSYEHWRETQWPDNKARCGSERNILVLENNDSNKLNGNNMQCLLYDSGEKSCLKKPLTNKKPLFLIFRRT